MNESEVTLHQKVIKAEHYLANNYPNLFLVFVFLQMIFKVIFTSFELDVDEENTYWTIVVMWCITAFVIPVYCFFVVGNRISLWSSYGAVVPIIWLTSLLATAILGRLRTV